MKNRLFLRLFCAFTAVLLFTVCISSFFTVAMVRGERQRALENEVLLQVRDIALLLEQQSYPLNTFIPSREPAIDPSVRQKIASVCGEYDCSMWLVYSNGIAWTMGSDTEISSEQLTSATVLEQLYRVLGGEEIHTRGLFRDDQNMVTVGAPWRDLLGRVQGAVMLHISVANLRVEYSDLLHPAGIAAALALTFGTVLSILIASSQTKPLRRITASVADFARGDMSSRIEVRGHGDIADLAVAINRMAEDLSHLEESRREFVASVSHELRSPLTCIRGYIESMQDGTIPPEEQGPYLQIVIDETSRLTALVNDLLDLSRIESGKVTLQRTVFDISELIRLTLIKFEQRIDRKDLDVEALLPEGRTYVNADSARIAQVLTNLIDNAIKFLPDRGVLTVSARVSGEICTVGVRDTGPGIAQEDLPYVFDRFYKADKAHTSGMGTGLGLAIVKTILDQHGQSVHVTSGPGGTEFTFTLPAAEAPDRPHDTNL